MLIKKGLLIKDRFTGNLFLVGLKIPNGTTSTWELYNKEGKRFQTGERWIHEATRPYWLQSGVGLSDRLRLEDGHAFVKISIVYQAPEFIDSLTGIPVDSLAACVDDTAVERSITKTYED